jgi:hypothetical protein
MWIKCNIKLLDYWGNWYALVYLSCCPECVSKSHCISDTYRIASDHSFVFIAFCAVTPFNHYFISRLPIIPYIWGMGSSSYMNLLVAGQKLLQEPNVKLE